METSLKTGFAQIFSCCPTNLSCPNFGGGCSRPRPPPPPARTPMFINQETPLMMKNMPDTFSIDDARLQISPFETVIL